MFPENEKELCEGEERESECKFILAFCYIYDFTLHGDLLLLLLVQHNAILVIVDGLIQR